MNQCDLPAVSVTMTAIDFECTGTVDGFPNVPWQIGLMPVVNGMPEPAHAFQSLLRVPKDQPFNLYTPGRWAQQREEIASAPSFLELWPTIKKLLVGRPLIAHHAPTERGVLKQFFPLEQLGPWVDTLTIARTAYPQLPDYKLENVMPNLGWQDEINELAPGRAPHDAFYDATACAVFLKHILKFPGWSSATINQLSHLK